MSDTVYDLCVVGAGMIGSAAAKHATELGNVKVCLVGPREPENRHSTTVFGAYYDVGRISRRTDQFPFWAYAAQQSIQRYRDIEKRSGIKFFKECGNATIASSSSEYLNHIKKSCAKDLDGLNILNAEHARSTFPYMHFTDALECVYEPHKAGVINPRNLVQAQQTIATQQGCNVVDDVVEYIVDDAQSGRVRLDCRSGRQIQASKVLLATGAFTNFRHLLPPGVHVGIQLIQQAVILAEIPPQRLETFSNMPTVLYTPDAKAKSNFGLYILPPIKYPDGKYYIKMGDTQLEKEVHTEQQVIDWYRSPLPKYYRQHLRESLHNVFPDLNEASVAFDTCFTSNTPNRMPFIDILSPRFGVALGGNGYAAKSSDELGRLAIQLLINNIWDCPFDKEDFKVNVTLSGKI